MSERGVFAIDRGVWEHDFLADPQPFSRREAWLWLLSEAAWKNHRRRILGRSIEVRRGQLAASYRFIAAKWQWSEARVRRFVSGLISECMVDAMTDAGVTVITICNYDKYQRVSLPSDAMPESDVDAASTQQRRKVEDKEYKEDTSSLRSEVSRVRKATRLPDDWKPSDGDLQAAAQRGLVGADLRTEIEKFRNYWHAKGGKDATKRDWSATWRNWCITWSERRGTRPHPQGRTSGQSDFLSGLASLATNAARDDPASRSVNPEIPSGRIEIDG